jgi:hypothetical protein
MNAWEELARSLGLEERELALPLSEFEALVLERLRGRAYTRGVKEGRVLSGTLVTRDELVRLAHNPALRCTGEIARAKLMRAADEAEPAAEDKRDRRQRKA